jgi:hypothetical protein
MRLEMKRFLFTIALLAVALPAAAQNEGYRLRLYNRSAQTPITEVTFTAAQASCNQNPPAVTSSVNPRYAIWDDTANAGKVCIWDGSAPLLALPPTGTFDATLSAQIGGVFSDESDRAPFSRAVPGKPVNLRFGRVGS